MRLLILALRQPPAMITGRVALRLLHLLFLFEELVSLFYDFGLSRELSLKLAAILSNGVGEPVHQSRSAWCGFGLKLSHPFFSAGDLSPYDCYSFFWVRLNHKA